MSTLFLFSGLIFVGFIFFAGKSKGGRRSPSENKAEHHNRIHKIEQEIQLHEIERESQQVKDRALLWDLLE